MDNDNDSRIKDIIYKRKNGYDIVNDPEAIASCKQEQSRDIIDNSRLGSYDKYGNYIIIPEIKRELISMPKLIYNQYSGGGSKIYELRSSLPIFNDVFMKLVITGDMANLLICEQVNREAGGYLESYDEVIDSLAIGTEERMPQSLIFRTYNIFEDPNDFGKELKDSKFDNILTRKVYLSLLSKELKNVSTLDEKVAFKNMVSTLKQSGSYGNKVLNEFLGRLKDRPAIFEISKAENYNKAMNEVLLSSLEVATTEQDKQSGETRQVYLSVLNERDRNIEEGLRLANDKVSEEYVKHIVDKAKEDFVFGATAEQQSASDEFYSKLNEGRAVRRRTLDKPVLKQGKESLQEEPKTKEEKIKQILNKNAKKTPKGQKLKASKGKKAVKKLKAAKKKTAKKANKKVKKKVKAKVKSKKKVKKAKPKKKVKKVKKKLKKAKLKSKKKVKKSKPKKKLGKKKSPKKKVKRKIAKSKLKKKKGKIKSKKKKKVKKPKNAKKAKKVSKVGVKKPGGAKPQKFSAAPKSAKKKNSGMSLSMKYNVYGDQPVVEKEVELSFSSNKYKTKSKKEEEEEQEKLANIVSSPAMKIKFFESGDSEQRNVSGKDSGDKKTEPKSESAIRGQEKYSIKNSVLDGLNKTLNGSPQSSPASVIGSTQHHEQETKGTAQQTVETHSDVFSKLLNHDKQDEQSTQTPQPQSATIPKQDPPHKGEVLNDILNNIQSQQAQQGDKDKQADPLQQQEQHIDPPEQVVQEETEEQIIDPPPQEEEQVVEPPPVEETEEQIIDSPIEGQEQTGNPLSSEKVIEDILNNLDQTLT